MKNIIPKNTKVRIITLGCGSDIPRLLMGEGSSAWLDSIHILYSRENIDKFCPFNSTSKYVSKERCTEILEFDERSNCNNVVTLVITASLGFKGQREGRVNNYHMGVRGLDGSYDYFYGELDNTRSREEQEWDIRCVVEDYFLSRNHIIFAGSFNPYHKAHDRIFKEIACSNVAYNHPIIQITSNHPEKGEIPVTEIQERFNQIKQDFPNEHGYDFEVSGAPTYYQKYKEWIVNMNLHPIQHNENLIFIIGSDVWKRFRKGFASKFNMKDPVSFLIFNRDNYEPDEFDESSWLTHPLSFSIVLPEDIRNLSSTQIRNDKATI